MRAILEDLIFFTVIVIALTIVTILAFPLVAAKVRVGAGGLTFKERVEFLVEDEAVKKASKAYTFLMLEKDGNKIVDCIKFLDCVEDSDEDVCKNVYKVKGKKFCEDYINSTLKEIFEKCTVTFGKNYNFTVDNAKKGLERARPVVVTYYLKIPYSLKDVPSHVKVVFEIWE